MVRPGLIRVRDAHGGYELVRGERLGDFCMVTHEMHKPPLLRLWEIQHYPSGALLFDRLTRGQAILALQTVDLAYREEWFVEEVEEMLKQELPHLTEWRLFTDVIDDTEYHFRRLWDEGARR